MSSRSVPVFGGMPTALQQATRSDVKTRRRVLRDIEDNLLYDAESSDSDENELHMDKYANGESVPKLPYPVNIVEDKDIRSGETKRKAVTHSPLMNVIICKDAYKKYLRNDQESNVYTDRDALSMITGGRRPKVSTTSANSDISEIMDKVTKIKSRHRKIGKSVDKIRSFVQSAPKATVSKKVNIDLTKAIDSARRLETADLGISNRVWVDRLKVGYPKAIVPVENRILNSIKKSWMHTFNLHDKLPYTIYTIEKRPYVAEASGSLFNTHGKILYSGQIKDGKLNGRGRLYNTRLLIESFLQ